MYGLLLPSLVQCMKWIYQIHNSDTMLSLHLEIFCVLVCQPSAQMVWSDIMTNSYWILYFQKIVFDYSPGIQRFLPYYAFSCHNLTILLFVISCIFMSFYVILCRLMPFHVSLDHLSLKSGGGVKYVFLGLRRHLRCQAKGKNGKKACLNRCMVGTRTALLL
jgi:hypothetical protein